MDILITGAAGMIGRKLISRLAADATLGGRPIDRLTLVDIAAPAPPESFPGAVLPLAADLAAPGVAEVATAGKPDIIFHLAAVVSGEAEADFEKGYRVNLDGTHALFEAIWRHGPPYRPRVVFTSSIAAYGAPFPDTIAGRFPHRAADQLRDAEGDCRTAAGRLHAARHAGWDRRPAAQYLRPPWEAEQGCVGVLLEHSSRAACRPGSGAAGRRACAHVAC